MKKKIIIICTILIIGAVILLVFLLPKNQNNNDNNTITKIETKKDGTNEIIDILLNGKSHQLVFKEKEDKNVDILFDDKDILSFPREYYDDNFTSDIKTYKEIIGADNKYYFSLALANWQNNKYIQYLFVFNDEGKIIYHIEDKDFGAAFTDYENVTQFYDIYGDTGKFKLFNDKIVNLKYFSYTDGDDFIRCQENIITIKDDEIFEDKGDLVKVAMVS